VLAQKLFDGKVCDGITRGRGIERVPSRVPTVAADRCLDATTPGARPTADEREIFTFHRAPAEQALQAAVRLLGAGNDQEAGGVAVEPMDDARPLGLRTSADATEQTLHQRAARMPRRRVNDEPSRLVDHQDVLVLVRESELAPFGLLCIWCSRGDGDREFLARAQAVALRATPPVDEHGAGSKQPLRRGTRADFGLLSEEAVDPRAGSIARDAKTERQGARRGRRGSRSTAIRAPSRTTTPTTMNVSARLNAGQKRKSRKSVT